MRALRFIVTLPPSKITGVVTLCTFYVEWADIRTHRVKIAARLKRRLLALLNGLILTK